MPRSTNTTKQEQPQPTKSANKNIKSSTTKKVPTKSTNTSSELKNQAKRNIKSKQNSNNTQDLEEDDDDVVERNSVLTFIKMQVLLHKYSQYKMSDKGKAEMFVRKHLKAANKKMLVEIVEIDAPKYYEIGYMQFKTVICELYPKTMQSQYPPRSMYADKDDYKFVCNAIDWETAQKDIKRQKKNGCKRERYRIEGVVYLNTKDRPHMFLKHAPDHIKALANDVKDKSNAAWEQAYKYLNPEYMNYDVYKYKIKNVEKIQ